MMKELTTQELKQINGGAIGTYLLVAGIVIFIIGVIDGYVRPLKCG